MTTLPGATVSLWAKLMIFYVIFVNLVLSFVSIYFVHTVLVFMEVNYGFLTIHILKIFALHGGKAYGGHGIFRRELIKIYCICYVAVFLYTMSFVCVSYDLLINVCFASQNSFDLLRCTALWMPAAFHF